MTIVQEQIEKAEAEVTYFESFIQQLETASPKDIDEIREELKEEGYIKNKQKKQSKKKHELQNQYWNNIIQLMEQK